MLRPLYDRLLKIAQSPRAEPALAAISFAEASFFPLMPDIMLAPMAAARPERWWRFALVCTVASVVGGLFGYAIGFFLMDTLGGWIAHAFGFADKIDELRAFYDHWGFWAIILKGFTPIPFKLVTILSGALHYNLPMFVLGAALTRGVRFTLVAWLAHRFGPAMAPIIEKRIGLVALGLVLLAGAGIAAATLLH